MKTPSLGILPAATNGKSARMRYFGICEASAAVALDDSHFVVASDETNTLQVYRRGIAEPLRAIKLRKFIGERKSDIEAAARIGDRVYWISSHSRPEQHGNARDRSIMFSSRIVRTLDGPTLEPVGEPFEKLRGYLKEAIGLPGRNINIEGLATTPEGDLLIGFRAPLKAGMAIILSLKNPAGIAEHGEDPRLGAMRTLDLGGRGIRSIDWTGDPAATYLILAGPVEDGGGEFALYSWTGDTDAAVKLQPKLPKGFTAEALIPYPGKNLVQVLSDDGVNGIDEDEIPKVERRFRSIDVAY